LSPAELLETALTAADIRAVRQAVAALSEQKEELPLLLPRLAAALADAHPHPARRAAVVHALLGPLVRENLPALLTALTSKRWTVREAVVAALGRVAPEEPAVRSALVQCVLFDRTAFVRDQALTLLQRDGNVPPEVRAAHGHHHPRVRCRALHALARLVPPEEQLSALVQALDDSHFRVRRDAAGLFGRLGRFALPAVPRLGRCCFDGEPRVARAAAKSLGQITSEFPPELREQVSRLTVAEAGPEQALRAALEANDLSPPLREAFTAVCRRRLGFVRRGEASPENEATLMAQLDLLLAASGKRAARQASWLIGWLLGELVRAHQGTTR
jgi:HEAT repeat protein